MGFVLFFCIAAIVLFVLVKQSNVKRPPLPPGPPADPIIGHLRSIPPTNLHILFYKWGKIYGDVMHLFAPKRSMIVLSSTKAAIDLLDKRGHNYSDRPYLPIFELMGFFPTLPLLPYGHQFRAHRRMMKASLSKNECGPYRPIQARETHILLQDLLASPDRRDHHLSRFSTAIILRIVFGHQLTSENDVFFEIAKDASDALIGIGSPGGTAIDFFPFLQHLPDWFPGSYYAGVARRSKPAIRRLHDYPFEEFKEQKAKGNVKNSVLSYLLEALDCGRSASWNTAFDIQGAVGAMYLAGLETTWSSLSIFFLAMVFNPESQAKAQEEIDAVIGPNRLPGFEDRDSLPYVDALIQETLRWNHAIPMGVPHRAVEDDVYNGMFIPKGSMVIANTRAMSLDDRIYSDPSTFNPSRFLPKPIGNGEPHFSAAFGFGRRECPGRHLADSSLWISIACVLAVFNISKAIGKDGKEITPDLEFTEGLASHPVPFQCNIQPRHDAARVLIAQADVSDNY